VWKTEDIESGERPASHRVDIGESVGGGDSAEIERVVDNRREEIGGHNQRFGVVDLVDTGIIGRIGSDQKPLVVTLR
jgi:hypothetical protein